MPGPAGPLPPRRVLRPPQRRQRTTGRVGNTRTGGGTDAAPQSDPRLRRTRDKRLCELVADLDAVPAGPHLDELIGALHDELGLPGMPACPLGLVARCYLGPPYEVHVLDLAGRIIEHYEVGRAMPGRFEQARALALHDAYAFVEVTDTELRAVRADGSVTAVPAATGGDDG